MDVDPSSYIVHPDYDAYTMNYDIAVVKTVDSIPSAVERGTIWSGGMSEGDELTVYGRGDMIEDVSYYRLQGDQEQKGLGDLIDWIGDTVSDAVVWVGDTVTDIVSGGDDTDYGDASPPANDYSEPVVDEYEYAYDEYIYQPNEIVTSFDPVSAKLTVVQDKACWLFTDIVTDSSTAFCGRSQYQNICNGDSGGAVVDSSKRVVGIVSFGTPGCDASPPEYTWYESGMTDFSEPSITWFLENAMDPIPEGIESDADYDEYAEYGEQTETVERDVVDLSLVTTNGGGGETSVSGGLEIVPNTKISVLISLLCFFVVDN